MIPTRVETGSKARSGELFGFERTNSLIASAKSADEIATAARAFGQDDDITVVEVVITNLMSWSRSTGRRQSL
jgi:hypothetical protein